METVNNVLSFQNELAFSVKVNDGDAIFEKLRCVKRRLVTEFEDHNFLKMIKNFKYR